MKGTNIILLGIVIAIIGAIAVISPTLTGWEIKTMSTTYNLYLDGPDGEILGNQTSVNFKAHTSSGKGNITVYLYKDNVLIDEKKCTNCSSFSGNFSNLTNGTYKMNVLIKSSNGYKLPKPIFFKIGYGLDKCWRIVNPGNYYLTNSIYCYSMVLSSKNISLNCRGYPINNGLPPGPDSIFRPSPSTTLEMFDNDKIENCNIGGNSVLGRLIVKNNDELINSKVSRLDLEGQYNVFKNNSLNQIYMREGSRYFIQYMDTSNKIMGKPIYWLINKSNLEVPENASMVVLVNSKNMTVKNINFSREKLDSNSYGIALINTTNSKIENCNLSNAAQVEIFLLNSSDNEIINSKITSGTGIILFYSNKNKVENNNIEYAHDGGILLLNSDNNKILSNKLKYHESQISIVGENNTIKDNNIAETWAGVYLSGVLKGSNNLVEDNQISNTIYGIILDETDNEKIINNQINSPKVGILILSSPNSTIQSNKINNFGAGIYLPAYFSLEGTIPRQILPSENINIISNVLDKGINGCVSEQGPGPRFGEKGEKRGIELLTGTGILVGNGKNIIIKSNKISNINSGLPFEEMINTTKLIGSGIEVDNGSVVVENNLITNSYTGITVTPNITVKNNQIRDSIIGISAVSGNIQNNLIKECYKGISSKISYSSSKSSESPLSPKSPSSSESSSKPSMISIIRGHGSIGHHHKLPSQSHSPSPSKVQVPNWTAENNEIFGCKYGVYSFGKTKIIKNGIHGNKNGIFISSNKEVQSIGEYVGENNIFRNHVGLYIQNSEKGLFEKNKIFRNDVGTYILNSTNDTFKDNKIFGNVIGIENYQSSTTNFDSNIIGWNIIGFIYQSDLNSIAISQGEVPSHNQSAGPLFSNNQFIANKYMRPFSYLALENSSNQPFESKFSFEMVLNKSNATNISLIIIPSDYLSKSSHFNLNNVELISPFNGKVKSSKEYMKNPITSDSYQNLSVININMVPDKIGYGSLKLEFNDSNNNTLIHYIPIFVGEKNKTYTSKVKYYLRFENNQSYLSINPPTQWEITQIKEVMHKKATTPTQKKNLPVRTSGYLIANLQGQGSGVAVPIIAPPAKTDTTPPKVTINSPQNRTYTSNDIFINVTATDDSGISKVIAEVDHQNNITLTNEEKTKYYIGKTSLLDGKHTIRIYAYDKVGNVNSKTYVPFNVNSSTGIPIPKPKEVELIPKFIATAPIYKKGIAKGVIVRYSTPIKAKIKIPNTEKIKEKELLKRGEEVYKEQEDKVTAPTNIKKLVLQTIDITNVSTSSDYPSTMEIEYSSNVPILPIIPTPGVDFLQTTFNNLTNISSVIDGIETQEIEVHMPVNGTYKIVYDGRLCDKNNLRCNFTDSGIGKGQDFTIKVEMGSEHTLNVLPYASTTQVPSTHETFHSFTFEQNESIKDKDVLTGDIGGGAIYHIKVTDYPNTGVSGLDIQTTTDIYDAYIDIEKTNETKNCVIPILNYVAYKYFHIDSNIPDEKIKSTILSVNISNDWIKDNNISNIYLIRCNPYGTYKAESENKTNKYSIFKAEIPGFSDWVIVGTKNITCPQPTNWSTCISGFQTRTVYKLANGTCKAFSEEKSCKVCPVCPQPTEWKLINGKANLFTGKEMIIKEKTNYKCGVETNYTCQPFNETKIVYESHCPIINKCYGLCAIWWVTIAGLAVLVYFALKH